MGAISKTRKVRDGHRARAATLINQASQALDSKSSCSIDLQDVYSELQRQRNVLLQLDKDILRQMDGDPEEEIASSSEFVMKLDRCIRDVSNFFRQEKKDIVKDAGPRRTSKIKSNVHLKRFSGDPLDWPAFWEEFRTKVHEQPDVAAPVKFHYLMAHLQDDAALLLSGFNYSQTEYNEAICILQDTYGKPKMLKQALLNAIFDIEAPDSTVTELIRFRSEFEGHIRGLKSLGCNVQEWGYVLVLFLLRKLPRKVVENINRAAKVEAWDLDDLRKAIDNEIDNLTMVVEKREDKTQPNCRQRNLLPVTVCSLRVLLYSSLAAILGVVLASTFYPSWSITAAGPDSSQGVINTPDRTHAEERSVLIRYRSRHQEDIRHWTTELDKFIEPYEGTEGVSGQHVMHCSEDKPPGKQDVCKFQDTWLTGNCHKKEKWGYPLDSPCILLKLSKKINWEPKVYETLDELPPEMPLDLRAHISNLTLTKQGHIPKMIWVSCKGENPADEEYVGPVNYSPWRGFPAYYFPYRNTPGYLSPIVAVQLTQTPPPAHVSIACKAWAKNIRHDRSHHLVLVHLQVLKD